MTLHFNNTFGLDSSKKYIMKARTWARANRLVWGGEMGKREEGPKSSEMRTSTEGKHICA